MSCCEDWIMGRLLWCWVIVLLALIILDYLRSEPASSSRGR